MLCDHFHLQVHDEKGFFQCFAVNFTVEKTVLHDNFVLRKLGSSQNPKNVLCEINILVSVMNNFESNGFVLGDQISMIVAHSAGGIGTRTAMLLSNNPKSCLVSNIILLAQLT